VTLRDKSGKVLLDAVPETEVEERAKDLPAEARGLLDMVRKAAAGTGSVEITIEGKVQ
jgi:hypothetical protein